MKSCQYVCLTSLSVTTTLVTVAPLHQPQLWPRLATQPKWLRVAHPALQQVILGVLARASPSSSDADEADGGMPEVLDLSSLGAGKVGRSGAEALAGLLRELGHQGKLTASEAAASTSLRPPVLRSLVLRGCGLDTDLAVLILEATQGLDGLQDIDFGSNTMLFGAPLPPSMPLSPLASTKADVYDEATVAGEVDRFCTALLTGCKSLTRLGLSGTGLSDAVREGGGAMS